ncbi:protein of unassigned function [Methylobacterium oryzae CBMB20]|uniref:Protein of unassigned function n=1 Tax=Methylobacterium oryzae CBMB20 TaxID=693986 RepID=A0A089Q097_9HYPH|nr:protein of unassigned function [Methylobacterium oryzae CBMB20]
MRGQSGLCLGAGVRAQNAPREFRIGYQKFGLIVAARQQRLIGKPLLSRLRIAGRGVRRRPIGGPARSPRGPRRLR